ncbi:MAG: hypothetical protein CM15mP109_09160 [Candidatus Dadabacteria bacterium]|nr:MAG: hypothetical protein CM15mP109_09160 [Candidatus Dadabacteria bacterium]
MNDYDSLINEYFKWAKKRTMLENYSLLVKTPLYPQNSFIRAGYDFVELLNTSHINAGKGWDKWLGTKSGKKIK